MTDANNSNPDKLLHHPTALISDSVELHRSLTSTGNNAQHILSEVLKGPGNTVTDRVAAAVILRSVYGTNNTLDADTVQDPAVFQLRWAPGLQPAAREILSEPIITSLLTWASHARPGEPPVAAAHAAAHLHIDDDGRGIYQKVSQRAAQLPEQRTLTSSYKNQLRIFTEALTQADQATRQPAAAPEDESAPTLWSAHDDRALEDLLGHGTHSPTPQSGPGPRRAYDPRALFDGPMSETQRADEKNVVRNWIGVAIVIAVIITILGFVL